MRTGGVEEELVQSQPIGLQQVLAAIAIKIQHEGLAGLETAAAAAVALGWDQVHLLRRVES